MRDAAEKIAGVLICTVLFVGALAGGIMFVGNAVDSIGQYQEQREACLKEATTFLEYDRCR